MSLTFSQPSLVLPLKPHGKFLPVVVQFDAAQMQKRFGFVLSPTHAGAIKAFSDQVAHGTFHLWPSAHSFSTTCCTSSLVCSWCRRTCSAAKGQGCCLSWPGAVEVIDWDEAQNVHCQAEENRFMHPAAAYRDLQGSRGQVHLQLPQPILTDLCRLFEHQDLAYAGKVRKVRVTPDKKKRANRFRIHVEFAEGLFQSVGKLFLHALGDDGIEIQIDQSCATPADPRVLASLETGMLGNKLAVPTVVNEINSALQAEVLKVESQGTWFSWSSHRAVLILDPFLLFKRLIDMIPALGNWLPLRIVDHLSYIELKTSEGCLLVDLTWQHTG